jgi:pyruvate formate lyase activating enzyme
MKEICGICPHHCDLEEGQTGCCRARTNRGGRITCSNYGKLTSIALDPIEKKPLARFMPGGKILSVGSCGCNLRCRFCQNHSISMTSCEEADTVYVAPETLLEKAAALIPRGNIGLAYTYNEPLIGYEFVYDCAKLIRSGGMKNVLVTNGYVCEEPLLELLPYIDAMNIDLKGFSDAFYKKVGGDLETVKRTIEICAKRCHVEVTTLVIPDENDNFEEIEELSKWLASVDPDIPYHLTRFFPMYKYSDRKSTPVKTVYALKETARKYLNHVYTGNC